jgi:rubrerythrin
MWPDIEETTALSGTEVCPSDADLDVTMLKTAFEIERYGLEFYSKLIGCVRDGRTAAVLRGLVSDAKKHLEILAEEIECFSKGLDVSRIKPLKEYLEFRNKPGFSIPENVCLTLEGEIKALGKGIEVEKRTMKMYSKELKHAKDPQLKVTLESLLNRVQNHVRQLEESIHWLRLDGNWYGYIPLLEG